MKTLISTLIILMFAFWTRSIFSSILFLIVLDTLLFKKIISLLRLNATQKALYFLGVIFISILITRNYFVDFYSVRTESMYSSISKNSYVVVNKFSYGPSLPESLSFYFPFSLISKPQSNCTYEYYDSFNFSKYKQNDICVFRDPRDEKIFYTKRIIGIPGGKIDLINGQVFFNDTLIKETKHTSFLYSNDAFKDSVLILSNQEFNDMSMSEKRSLKKRIYVNESSPNIFPVSRSLKWTLDNYGPVEVPSIGDEITLTADNIDVLRPLLIKYEKWLKSDITIGEKYIFSKNYYFVLGDSRHNSRDSRAFGLIPEHLIQGKVFRVL